MNYIKTMACPHPCISNKGRLPLHTRNNNGYIITAMLNVIDMYQVYLNIFITYTGLLGIPCFNIA